MFCGHLAVEKMFKALCAAKNIRIVKEHRLHVLAEMAGIYHDITDSEQDDLIIISRFNIAARYADYKQRFYETCTKEFTDEWTKKITSWYKNLKHITLQERATLVNNENDTQMLIK